MTICRKQLRCILFGAITSAQPNEVQMKFDQLINEAMAHLTALPIRMARAADRLPPSRRGFRLNDPPNWD